MARLVEVTIRGYKPIYKYEEYISVEKIFSEFVVYVPNRTDFKEGLCDSYNGNKTMTKLQAEKANNMEITKEFEPYVGSIVYSDLLKSNGFELTPE